MSSFEFVTVLISIVLGLGITQIMSGIADLIQQWERAKLYWIHILWVALVFVLHIQEWWFTFDLKSVPVWHMPFFLFEILYPISLFVLARILFPANGENVTDYRTYYYMSYRKFFLLLMVLSLLSALGNLFIHHTGPEGWIPNLALFTVLGIIAYRKVTNPAVHAVLVLVMVVTLTAGMIINYSNWVIND